MEFVQYESMLKDHSLKGKVSLTPFPVDTFRSNGERREGQEKKAPSHCTEYIQQQIIEILERNPFFFLMLPERPLRDFLAQPQINFIWSR